MAKESKFICSVFLMFVVFQVEWPVTCEENLESCSHLYSHSGELYEDLKARVQFPSDITESLQKNLETLQIKVKLQHSVLSGAQIV